MKTLDEARNLAREMVSIGKGLGRNTIAVLTNMNEPLGHEVGNANEVKEAIEALSGKGSKDLLNVSVTIASYMALLGGAFDSLEKAENRIYEIIEDGTALNLFADLVEIQGGNRQCVYDTDLLPSAKLNIPVIAKKKGYVHEIKAEEIGTSAMLLGAGRSEKEDLLDYGAGVSLKKKVGDIVNKGDTLCILLSNTDKYTNAYDKALDAFVIDGEVPEKIPYILDVIK